MYPLYIHTHECTWKFRAKKHLQINATFGAHQDLNTYEQQIKFIMSLQSLKVSMRNMKLSSPNICASPASILHSAILHSYNFPLLLPPEGQVFYSDYVSLAEAIRINYALSFKALLKWRWIWKTSWHCINMEVPAEVRPFQWLIQWDTSLSLSLQLWLRNGCLLKMGGRDTIM